MIIMLIDYFFFVTPCTESLMCWVGFEKLPFLVQLDKNIILSK